MSNFSRAESAGVPPHEEMLSDFANYTSELLTTCLRRIVHKYEQDSTHIRKSRKQSVDSQPVILETSPAWAHLKVGGAPTTPGADRLHQHARLALPDQSPAGGQHPLLSSCGASFNRSVSNMMGTVLEDSSSSASDEEGTRSKEPESEITQATRKTLSRISRGQSRTSIHRHSSNGMRSPTPHRKQEDTVSVMTSQSSAMGGAHSPGLPEWVKKSWKIEVVEQDRKSVLRPVLASLSTAFAPDWERDAIRTAVSRLSAPQDKGSYTDLLWAVLITLNAILVAWELQFFARGVACPVATRLASGFFTSMFTLELAVRFRMRGRACLRDCWDALDVMIVVCLWIQQAIRLMNNSPLWIEWDISILRMYRVVDWLSSVSKRIEALMELRLLLKVVGSTVRSVLWFWLFTSVMTYFGSIVLLHSTHDVCHPEDGSMGDRHHLLCEHFGTFWKTYWSCLKAMFGGLLWGDLIDILEVAPGICQVTLAMLVAFEKISVLNLILGMLLQVHAHDDKDLEIMVAEEERRTARFIEAMSEVFQEIDTNKSGGLSKTELELALEDPKMNALLRCFKLEMHDACCWFDLLDVHKTNTIQLEDFIAGCLKMRGGAQAKDMLWLQMQIDTLSESVRTWSQPKEKPPAYQVLQQHPLQWNRLASSCRVSGTHLGSTTSSRASFSPGRATVAEPHLRGWFSESWKATTQFDLLPDWSGFRIPSVEERAMLLSELRSLRNHIKLQSPSWTDERTRTGFKSSKVNMYHLNYNWICPLTVPDGVWLVGCVAAAAAPPPGTLIIQAPLHEGYAPRAVAEVSSSFLDGRLFVKVLRGKFDTSGEVMLDSQSLGVPTAVETPVAMSYKELVSNSPAKPTWYCCHWWGEPILDFMACIEEHCKLRQCSAGSSWWICAFANDQHHLSSEFSDSPETSSFRRAMLEAQGVLLVLDSEAMPFQRIWCDYELYKTVLDPCKALDIVTVAKANGRRQPNFLADLPGESAIKKTQREAKFPISLLAKGIRARLEEGEATVALDKEKILRQMREEFRDQRKGSIGEEEMLAQANQALNAYFAWCAWPQALKSGFVTNFPGSDTGLFEVTSREDARKELRLSLAHFEEVTDEAIADLAKGLPAGLLDLSLSFEGCMHVSDRALQHLAKGLQHCPHLQNLSLDFLGCKHISDLGLEALARGIPPSLQKLRFDFAKCHKVGIEGASSLLHHIPSGLREFSCTFKGTLIDRNFDSLAEFRQFTRGHGESPSDHHGGPRLGLSRSQSGLVKSWSKGLFG